MAHTSIHMVRVLNMKEKREKDLRSSSVISKITKRKKAFGYNSDNLSGLYESKNWIKMKKLSKKKTFETIFAI